MPPTVSFARFAIDRRVDHVRKGVRADDIVIVAAFGLILAISIFLLLFLISCFVGFVFLLLFVGQTAA